MERLERPASPPLRVGRTSCQGLGKAWRNFAYPVQIFFDPGEALVILTKDLDGITKDCAEGVCVDHQGGEWVPCIMAGDGEKEKEEIVA